MKKFVLLTLVLVLMLSIPVNAEEDEEVVLEVETEEGNEHAKGSRMNPYDFGDDIHLGKTYDDDGTYIDISIKFDEILDKGELISLYPDEGFDDGDYFALKGVLETGEASTDDDDLWLPVDVKYYTKDLKDYNYASFEEYTDCGWLHAVFSYMSYDIIIPCNNEDISSEPEYLRFSFYTSEEDYNNDEVAYAWMKLN